MNKVTISINIISFFVIKHRFKNGIILNEVNTSNKRESSQNMIEMLRSNSQDVSLSLYILRQIEDMPILHLLWLIAHLNYFFWCRSNISVLLRGGNRNNQTGRKITSRPTVIWLISWILKTIHGIKNWSDPAWQDSFGQTLAWVSLSYHKTSLHCKAVRLFTWAKEFLATSDRGVTQDVSEPGGGWGGC